MGFYYTQTDRYDGEVNWGRVIVTIIGLIVIWTLVSWFVYPQVAVYRQNLIGQANLKQQEWEKQIAIEEARAAKESATLYAEAEIERAKGVKEANEIIAESLKGNEEYLRYLWIDKVSGGEGVIYVPTEAALPILEAGKR